jgi:hypothetical protein
MLARFNLMNPTKILPLKTLNLGLQPLKKTLDAAAASTS